MKAFCVKCGKDVDITIDGMCIGCFLGDRKLTSLPHHIDLQICTNCGDMLMGNHWVSEDLGEAMTKVAEDNLESIKEAKVIGSNVTLLEQDPYTFVAAVDSVLDVGGQRTNDTANTIIRIKNTVCKRCSRQLGSYYEAILQIRTGGKDLPEDIGAEAMNRVRNMVDSQSINNRQLFITKTEAVQGGIDVYLSSISLGKALSKDLADAYGAETKEASKLVGQTEDGQEMYRVTYLVRLPDHHVGDVVLHDGRYCKLTRVSGTGGKVQDLIDFRIKSVRRSDMPLLKVHTRRGDLMDAVVISRTGNEVQILHPSKLSSVDLRIPEDAAIGETVKVADIDDVLYFVP